MGRVILDPKALAKIVAHCKERARSMFVASAAGRSRHGAGRAIFRSIENYHSAPAHKPDFKAHLLGGPKFDEFFVERDGDIGRDVET